MQVVAKAVAGENSFGLGEKRAVVVSGKRREK
jgi:hypothetical protein